MHANQKRTVKVQIINKGNNPFGMRLFNENIESKHKRAIFKSKKENKKPGILCPGKFVLQCQGYRKIGLKLAGIF